MRRSFLAGVLTITAALVVIQPRLPGQEKKPGPAEEEKAVLLQTVGLLSSAQVYQAYLNVGFVADGRATGTYDDKTSQEIIDSVLKLLTAAGKQLDKIGKFELTK